MNENQIDWIKLCEALNSGKIIFLPIPPFFFTLRQAKKINKTLRHFVRDCNKKLIKLNIPHQERRPDPHRLDPEDYPV